MLEVRESAKESSAIEIHAIEPEKTPGITHFSLASFFIQ